MRRVTLLVLVALFSLLSTTAVFAQDSDTKVIDFLEGDTIEGDIPRPEEVIRQGLGDGPLESLIQLRGDFQDRLTDTVEDL